VLSLQFLNSFSEVIFIIEFVILSGVWRGFLRQTQSKDPEEAHTAPTLRPFLPTNIAGNFSEPVQKLIAKGFLPFFVLGRHPEFLVVILTLSEVERGRIPVFCRCSCFCPF
jgi:hypothetical protein